MKKYAALTLSLMYIMLTGCNSSMDADKTEQISLQELPNDYTVELAKEDGCVIFENSDITCGQEIWDTFVEMASAEMANSVRLAFYYTLDDPSRYDPEYYELIKDNYPLLLIEDLAYDGTAYTIRWFEDDNEIIETYQFLMKYEGNTKGSNATYNSYVRYVLTNDNSVTWDDIWMGALSSRVDDDIDHHVVYIDLIFSN